jgi:hypothetical protein
MSVTHYVHACAFVQNKKTRKGGIALLVDPKWAKLITSYGEPTPIGFLLLLKIQLLFGVALITNYVGNTIHM